MSSATHTIDFNVEGGELKFRCHGDETSDCHQYPNCHCEWWGDDHEHPKVPHGHCWMDEWFANEGTEYTGDDGETNTFGTRPTKSRTGPITTDFQVDYLEWNWA